MAIANMDAQVKHMMHDAQYFNFCIYTLLLWTINLLFFPLQSGYMIFSKGGDHIFLSMLGVKCEYIFSQIQTLVDHVMGV